MKRVRPKGSSPGPLVDAVARCDTDGVPEDAMSRRGWLLWLGLLICLGTLGLLACLGLPGPRIDQGSFEKIQTGMTQQEVENLIGCSPGNYNGRWRIFHDGGLEGSDDRYKEWVGQEMAILVWLDGDGKVSRKESLSLGMTRRDSFLDRLRRLLRW